MINFLKCLPGIGTKIGISQDNTLRCPDPVLALYTQYLSSQHVNHQQESIDMANARIDELNAKIATILDLLNTHVAPRITALKAEVDSLKAAQASSSGITEDEVAAATNSLDGVINPLTTIASSI